MPDVFSRFSPYIQDYIYRQGWSELRPVQIAAAEVLFDTKDHLLLSTGLKHKEVTFVLLTVNLFFIGLGLLLRNVRIEIALLIVIICAVTLIVALWRIVDKYNTRKKESI